jgi:hypothetical protein
MTLRCTCLPAPFPCPLSQPDGSRVAYDGELKAPALRAFLAGLSSQPPPSPDEAPGSKGGKDEKKEAKAPDWAFVSQVRCGLGGPAMAGKQKAAGEAIPLCMSQIGTWTTPDWYGFDVTRHGAFLTWSHVHLPPSLPPYRVAQVSGLPALNLSQLDEREDMALIGLHGAGKSTRRTACLRRGVGATRRRVVRSEGVREDGAVRVTNVVLCAAQARRAARTRAVPSWRRRGRCRCAAGPALPTERKPALLHLPVCVWTVDRPGS